MKKVYLLVEVSQTGEFIDIIGISQEKAVLREILKKQELNGSWDKSYMNFKIKYGNSYHIYSRYIF